MGIENLKCIKCGSNSFFILPVIADKDVSMNLVRFIMDRDALPDIKRRHHYGYGESKYPRPEQIRRKISAVGNKPEELSKYGLERVKNVKAKASKGMILLEMQYRGRGDTSFKKATCQLFKSSKESGITCAKCGKVYTNILEALDKDKTEYLFNNLADEMEKTRLEDFNKNEEKRKKQLKALHEGIFEDDD